MPQSAVRSFLESEAVESGVAQWLACWAHNSKVGGSKPLSASFAFNQAAF